MAGDHEDNCNHSGSQGKEPEGVGENLVTLSHGG